jgi:DNA polymerase-1
MVIADDGNLLVSADYSQAELRTLAVLSGDEALIRVYEQGLDLHKEVAAYMYNVKPEDVTKEQRQTAKSVSFAIVYGGGAQVISGQLGVPISDGEKFVTAFYARFPTVKVWSENQFKTALDVGCIKSPSGRLRRFPFVPDSDIEEVRKQSINSPVQATASDAMLMSLILLDQRFRDRPDMYSDCRIIMPLHDSLLIEVPAHKAEQVCELVKRAMAYAPSKLLDVSRVPFLVDAKISKTWGE